MSQTCLPQLESSICCHFGISFGQRFFHHWGLEKCWGAVQQARRSIISLRIFLEGSRGVNPLLENQFCLSIMFAKFHLEF